MYVDFELKRSFLYNWLRLGIRPYQQENVSIDAVINLILWATKGFSKMVSQGKTEIQHMWGCMSFLFFF